MQGGVQRRVPEATQQTMRPNRAVNDVGGGSGRATLEPAGLPAWLATFIAEAERENLTLAENGATHAVAARAALLARLQAAARAWLDTEVTVEEAAALLGRHPETIRRALRKGTLPNCRTSPRGQHRIRRGALDILATPKQGTYDPIADAQDIAQRRSK